MYCNITVLLSLIMSKLRNIEFLKFVRFLWKIYSTCPLFLFIFSDNFQVNLFFIIFKFIIMQKYTVKEAVMLKARQESEWKDSEEEKRERERSSCYIKTIEIFLVVESNKEGKNNETRNVKNIDI